MVNNREENLPEVGKYNAGQKLLFFALITCMVALLLSGLVMWQPLLAPLFPVTVIRAASLLHAFFATVLIVLIIVHAYSAIWVAGSMGAMVRGYVTRGWAWKHHRAWLREVRPRGQRQAALAASSGFGHPATRTGAMARPGGAPSCSTHHGGTVQRILPEARIENWTTPHPAPRIPERAGCSPTARRACALSRRRARWAATWH